jgi:hypothetical protein
MIGSHRRSTAKSHHGRWPRQVADLQFHLRLGSYTRGRFKRGSQIRLPFDTDEPAFVVGGHSLKSHENDLGRGFRVHLGGLELYEFLHRAVLAEELPEWSPELLTEERVRDAPAELSARLQVSRGLLEERHIEVELPRPCRHESYPPILNLV